MTRRPVLPEIALIGLLCFLAYGPTLSIPLIEDDYPNLTYAQIHGSPAAITGLLHDPIFRVRATSAWLMFGVWEGFGLAPAAAHSVSLLLHFFNCLLLYAVVRLLLHSPGGTSAFACQSGVKPKTSPEAVTAAAPLWCAAFFAVHQGHQEAVMWFSACNELLLFLFGTGSLACWLLAERGDLTRGRRLALEAASVLLFALALASKESAVIWLPLFFLARTLFSPAESDRRAALLRLLPHAVLAALAIASVWTTRQYSFRFADGSFSFAAPFWITWPRGLARLLWPWGWLSLAAVAWFRDRKLSRPALASLAWMGVALAPYSFLTYSTQIPSRQTYLAGAGLALLAGLAGARLSAAGGRRRVLAAVLALAVLFSNFGYLWTRKHLQFLERAQPTEQLIRLARVTDGPIWVQCFPRNRYIAEEAVRVGAGRSPDMLVWSEADAARRHPAATFCYTEPGVKRIGGANMK
jgi:hypothetical protein